MDTRQDERNGKVVIGLDLTDEYAQLSYFFMSQDEPDTLKAFQGEKYNIPVCLLKKSGANQWYYGEQALRGAVENKGVLVKNLLKTAHEADKITVDGAEVETVALLSLFVKKCLGTLGILMNGFQVEALMITVDEFSQKTARIMEQLKKSLPYEKDKIFIQCHAESLFYYIVNQDKELWNRDVAVFGFREGKLYSYLFSINRKTTPQVVMIQREEYDHFVMPNSQEMEKNPEGIHPYLDKKFLEILEVFTRGKLMNTIYLIGSEFEQEWYKESLAFLCRTKRIFGGNNLYSKGACYSVKEKIYPGDITKNYLFLGNDKLKYNIGVRTLQEGKEGVTSLLDAGVNWYEVNCEREFLLDEGEALEVVVTSLYGQENVFEMKLAGLPERPRKATRLLLQIYMENEHHLHLHVVDKGFGNFFLASGKVWDGLIEV